MKRKITLKSIKDQHTVDFTDGGITREGEPTSQRQALHRVLTKRIPAKVDGKDVELPCFMIVDVGPWKLAPNESAPATDEAIRFEEDVIRREWTEAQMAKWNKARDGFIDKSIEARRQAEAQLEQQRGGDVAKSIMEMVKHASQPTTQKGSSRV